MFQTNKLWAILRLSQSFLLLFFTLNLSAQTYIDCLGNNDQVGGRVYLDYDSNSNWESSGNYSENGTEDISVSVYGNLGNLIGTTTTNAKGEWGMVVGNGVNVRVEFNLPDHFTAAPVGGSSKSQVAFATAPDCNVDLGVHDPIEYCESDPEVAMICHVKWWANGATPLTVSIDYSDGSNSTTDFSGYLEPNHPILVPNSETGNLWGLTYNKELNLIYGAANYKGDSNPSSDGLGAIYFFDNTTNTGANASLNTATLLTSLSAGTDPANGEPWNAGSGGTYFAAAFDGPGKLGLGGLALNGNGDTLWTINLFSRKLIGIPLAANGKSATGTNVSIDMPSPASCVGDEIRPWALKWYRGKLYIGMVCSGEVTQDINKVRGYVYTYTPGDAAMSASSVLEIDFGYTRGDASYGSVSANWNPWKTVWNAANPMAASHVNGGFQGAYPTPIIADIEFDKGDMILGILDRFGDQFQSGADPAGVIPGNPVDNNNIYMVPAGEMMKAGYNGNGSWSCESDAEVVSESRGTYSSMATVTGQGPGGKEFYFYDYYANHEETTLGGLASLPGRHEILVGAYDPTPLYYDANTSEPRWGSGGIIWFDNNTGGYSKGWEGYYNNVPGNYNKGNGFGDLEPICTEKPTLEIGNLIWDDADLNGSQDAGESGIPGVLVTLYSAAGTILATTTTDANGNYLFSKDGTAGQNWLTAIAAVEEGTTYYLSFGVGQYSGSKLTVSGAEYELASTNAASTSTNPDFIDSDASEGIVSDPAWVQNLPFVQVTTNEAGYNIHNFDVGFEFLANVPLSLLNFYAEAVDCNLDVVWNIENADNFSHFEIEQAAANGIFKKHNSIEAESQKNYYQQTIENERNAIQYLRLKMVDFDGTIAYSDIVNVRSNCGNDLEWNVFPNPADKSSGVNIEIKNAERQLQIEILDAVGKKYFVKQLDPRSGIQQIGISKFLPGIYTLILSDENGYRSTKKLVITQ